MRAAVRDAIDELIDVDLGHDFGAAVFRYAHNEDPETEKLQRRHIEDQARHLLHFWHLRYARHPKVLQELMLPSETESDEIFAMAVDEFAETGVR